MRQHETARMPAEMPGAPISCCASFKSEATAIGIEVELPQVPVVDHIGILGPLACDRPTAKINLGRVWDILKHSRSLKTDPDWWFFRPPIRAVASFDFGVVRLEGMDALVFAPVEQKADNVGA